MSIDLNREKLKALANELAKDIKAYGNTRLKINDQRTAFLIPDILVDSPQNF